METLKIRKILIQAHCQKSLTGLVNTKRTLQDASSQAAKISEFLTGMISEILGTFLERLRGGFGLQTCRKGNLRNNGKSVFRRINCIHENQDRNNYLIAQLYLQICQISKALDEYAWLSLQ